MKKIGLIAVVALSAIAAYADDRTVCAKGADPDQAIQACTRLIENKGQNAQNRSIALASRGAAYKKKENYEAAVTDYTKAIELNGSEGRFRYNRGVILVLQNNDEGALADFNEAIKLSPKDMEPYLNRAMIHYRMKDLARSIADLDAAIALSPKAASLYLYRGQIHRANDEKEHAVADFRTVLELEPSNQEARGFLRDLGAEPK